MQFNKVVNATPHPLRVYNETGTRVDLELPRNDADPIARAGERTVRLSDAEISGVRIAIYGTAYVQLTGLREPHDGVTYVVALPPAILATDRDDLLVCGPPVRDDQGRMIGCKGLSVPNHPVAAHPEPRRFRTKEDLGKLYVQRRGPFTWSTYTPYGLARVLFAQGLISKEEIDLAERDFGHAWTAHSEPRTTPKSGTSEFSSMTDD